jgi:dihydroxyacetone kinase
MYEATIAAHGGAGCLYLYGNYQGDVMNFDMAIEMAAMDDIRVETVLAADDVASAPRDQWQRRRGVAGIFFAYKIAGAAAEEGADLDEVVRVTRRTVEKTASMGVALSPCTVPMAGVPTFIIGDDEMEIGMGIHGEAGVHRGALESADEIGDRLLEATVDDLALEGGEAVAVLVNGLGATPTEELYLLYRKAHQRLVERGVKIHRAYVGEYATSLEMAGASLSVLKLDAELTRLLDAPARSPFFEQQ